MATASSAWLRLYTEALDDLKVQRLPGDTFKGWINLLMLAKLSSPHDGFLPPLEVIAYRLRTSDEAAQALVDKLIAAGLIDESEDGLRPHGWDNRQTPSDSSADRVRKHRAKKAEAGNVTDDVTHHVTGDVTRNNDETSDVTEAETSETQNVTVQIREEERREEENREDRSPSLRSGDPKRVRKVGSRLPETWQPSEDDIAFARSQGMTEDVAAREAEQFRDFWLAKPGQVAVKLDWHRTWCSWVRSTCERRGIRAPQPQANGQAPPDGPTPPADETADKLRLAVGRDRKMWSRPKWGPAPHEPGYLGNPAFVLPDDGRNWIEWSRGIG